MNGFADQSEKARAITLSEVHQYGIQAAYRRRMYADFFGVLPEHIDALFKRVKLPSKPFFTGDMYSQLGVERYTLDSSCPKVLFSADKSSRIKMFPCEFRALPAVAVRNIPEVDVDEAKIFALFLERDDMRDVIHSTKSTVESDFMHVTSAFAYLRYYEDLDSGRIKKIEIAEIQSDFFSKIGNRALQERYKHWEEILLTAFEVIRFPENDTSRSSFQAMFNNLRELVVVSENDLFQLLDPKKSAIMAAVSGSLSLPLPRVVRDRWACITEAGEIGLDAGKAEKIYGVVPAKLGYQIQKSDDLYFPEVSPSGTTVNQMFRWQKSIQSLDSISIHSFTAQLAPYIQSVEDQDLTDSLEQYEKAFPPFIFSSLLREGIAVSFPTMGSKIQSLSMLPGVVAVPVEPLSEKSISGLTESMHRAIIKQFRSTHLQAAASVLEPEFTFFSTGIESGLNSDWWTLPGQQGDPSSMSVLGISNQKRHPSLRLSLEGETGDAASVICIGAKGAGLTVHQKQDYWFPIGSQHPAESYPILKCKYGDTEQIPSHQYWGGMRLDHAVAEYRNAVGLTYLFEAIGEDSLARVAFPLSVAKLHSVPLTTNDGTEWIGAREYLFNILEDQGEDWGSHLAVYLSTSNSDVRLSQVINRVMLRSAESQANTFECKHEIDSALSYLFDINGSKLYIPPDLRIVPSGALLGPAQYQSYINKVLKANQKSGERIYHKIASTLLSTVGVVHGAGGHLGGGCIGFQKHKKLKDYPVGAVGGGAVTLRNVDCCGCLHDLDADVFLPWVSPSREDPALPLQIAQLLDKKFMQETLYWFKAMLIGIPVSDQDVLSEASLAHAFNKVNLFSSAPMKKGEVISPSALVEEILDLADVRLRSNAQNSIFPEFREALNDSRSSTLLRKIDLARRFLAPLELSLEERALYEESFKRGEKFQRLGW